MCTRVRPYERVGAVRLWRVGCYSPKYNIDHRQFWCHQEKVSGDGFPMGRCGFGG
jgi:hypothetical protein